MKYSVIDISSSSISMIVAAKEGDKAEVVFKERASLSLVHYLEEGALSARGTQKLTEMLARFKETGAELGVERCYLIATAALRHVKNFDEVAKEVFWTTGLTVNLIDGATEAYCDYVANLYYGTYERSVLIDLGGKSIEICDLSKTSKEEMMCFSFGLLDLYRKFVSNIYPDEKEAKEIKRYVREKFDRAGLPREGVFSTAVLVGATAGAIYDIYAEFSDERGTDGVKTIRRKKFKKLVSHLLEGEDRSRLILNNAPEKLYLIGSAVIVLKHLFKRFDVENIVVSERGVKEGYLQLVLEGRETGAYYDFVSNTSDGVARSLPASERGGEKRKKSAAKTKKPAAKGTGKASAQAAQGQAPAPAKKRGRPKKTEQPAPVSEVIPQAAQEQAPMPAKKRGRPKKAEHPAPVSADAPQETADGAAMSEGAPEE